MVQSSLRKISSVNVLVVAFVILLTCGIAVPAASGDTIGNSITYDVTGAFASGGTLSGTFTIAANPSDGLYSSNGVTRLSSATITADGNTFTCPEGDRNACIVYNSYGNYTQYGINLTSGGSMVFLRWLIDSATYSFTFLTGPKTSDCFGCANGGEEDYLASGVAVDPPPTDSPEPATGLLLLTALVGLAFIGATRKTVHF